MCTKLASVNFASVRHCLSSPSTWKEQSRWNLFANLSRSICRSINNIFGVRKNPVLIWLMNYNIDAPVMHINLSLSLSLSLSLLSLSLSLFLSLFLSISISNRFLLIFFFCADHTLVIHLEVQLYSHLIWKFRLDSIVPYQVCSICHYSRNQIQCWYLYCTNVHMVFLSKITFMLAHWPHVHYFGMKCIS